MATPARDKYYLRTLHEEISLFDRKIAHLQKYNSFPTEHERETALLKLSNKRETLVKTARAMAEEGIEFRGTELPKSLRSEDSVIEAEEPKAVEAKVQPAMAAVRDQPVVSINDNSILDFRNEVREYMQKRRKVYASEAP